MESRSMNRMKTFRNLEGLLWCLLTMLFLFILVPTCLYGVYLHGQKISYFLRPLWESPPKGFNEIPPLWESSRN
ncbi:hypothetical protein LINPERHAP1_LOCUS19190, partial [Linum perenne]